MLDDSWDSASSPDVKKKTFTSKSNNQKLGSMDSKYNFPAPTSTKRPTYNDDSYDNDILFSPTNSQGSPSASPVDYKNRSYNFTDSPAKDANADYLANFVTESADLEDSILGGLLGGGKKPVRQGFSKPLSPKSKLEPIDSHKSDYSPFKSPDKDNSTGAFTSVRSPQGSKATSRRSSPPKSYKASNFRSTSPFSDLKPIMSDDDSDFPIAPAFGMKRQNSAADKMDDEDFGTTKLTSEPVKSSFESYSVGSFPSPKQKARAQPSFDVTNDAGFFASLERDEELHASGIPVVKKFTDGLVRPKTSAGRDQLPSAGNNVPSTTIAKAGGDLSGSETLGSNKTADKEDEKEKDDTAGLAFIPSFMEPGRQNRRRRQLDTSPGKTFSSDDFSGGTKGGAIVSGNSGAGAGGMPKLQDLDLALGLGGPTTGPKKTFVDPFSAVDKKMPQLEKQASVYAMDSDDSSSDDALLNRNRYGRKDSFVTTKPATGTTTTAQGASTVTKEASNTFSASSAFPPSSHAAPVTAPSRLSTFTPAKPVVETAAPTVTAAVQSQQTQSAVSGQQNAQNKAPVNLSDSFEEPNLSPGGYKPTAQSASGGAGTSDTAYSNASLASLPIISPTASFRISSTSNAQSSGNKKAKESVSKQEFDEDSDDLDVSGIVRIDIEEDLLVPRSGLNRTNSSSMKSPSNSNKESNAANRPKSGSRSPRASFTDAPVNPHDAARGATGAASHAAHQSIRTNSPAGMLTAAVNNFDANDASHSRRNSASSTYARPTSPVQAKTSTVSTFQDGLVRDRSAVSAPVAPASALGTVNSFNSSGYSNAFIPAESTYSGFVARRGRGDSITEVEESPQDDVRPRTTQQSAPTMASNVVPAPAEYVPLDRAERESQIHRETENLKVRLSHPQPASFQHSVVHSLAEEREHYRILQDNNIQYVQEVLDQKRLIAHLESEISRLKDEANIKAHRNQEEMLYLKEKYEGEIRDIKIKNSIETESLERRQEESLSSLKKLHAHEIEAIKERYKSEEKFEQIAGQLRTTSGSIRFIEEQLQSKQRGVELIREGQIDARERLLADMEAKARERAELAEAEGYRLKGILSHMEHVVSSLREQGSEEKERLRQEHSRLQARQTAFEAERVAQQHRNMEELAYVKQRSKEVELELVKLTQEKQAQFEAIAAAQSKLDSERAEFNAFVASSKRALEQTEARLKEEDARVGRLRNEMLLEKTSLEDRRVNAIRDIEGAEELRAVLLRAQQENETEKEELRRISQSYKAASEELMQHQAELQEQQAALEERELALREGFAQMKLAAGELTRRESAIKDSVQFLDRKRMALDRADRESMENRLVSAANFREWSVRQSAETLPLPAPPGRYHHSSAGAGAGMGWDDRRGESRDGNTAEDVFNKYDVFGGSDGGATGTRTHPTHHHTQPMRSSAEESYFQGVRNLAGAHRMSKSAEFDGGFDTHRGGNQSYFASTAPLRASSEKENLYAQVLQSQQQETPWIETFQSKLKQAFSQGGAGSTAGDSEAHSRLPAEVRTAQMALRQSRGQLTRVTSSTLNVQRLLEEEGEFLKALQRNKTQPGGV